MVLSGRADHDARTLEPDAPPPDRCGTCTRCIEACPTQALVPDGDGWTLDARRCISYLNIELRGPIPEEQRAWLGSRVFGCDICQEVCPWNARAPETSDPAFQPLYDPAPPLEDLAALSAEEFRERFRGTPVMRAKHEGIAAQRCGGDERIRGGSRMKRRAGTVGAAAGAGAGGKTLPRRTSSPSPGISISTTWNSPKRWRRFARKWPRIPNSPDAYNHVAHAILYREMFRSGALESELVTGSNPFLRREGLNPSKKDDQEFQDSINRALALAEPG